MREMHLYLCIMTDAKLYFIIATINFIKFKTVHTLLVFEQKDSLFKDFLKASCLACSRKSVSICSCLKDDYT
jgi:hypothetical protein